MFVQLLYSVFIRTSYVTVMLWAISLLAGDTWFAKAALTVSLLLLLITGLGLLALGVRDLFRDLRHILHARLHKDGHA
jgi:hypothetical protein